MTRGLASALVSIWLLAQLGPDGVAVRCWALNGLSLKGTAPKTLGPRWISRDPDLAGWIQGIEVRGGDYRSAADAIGIADPALCGIPDPNRVLANKR